MSAKRRASTLAGIASGLLLVTAVFHFTGLGQIALLGTAAGEPLATLAPLLWIAFSINLGVLALAAALIREPAQGYRWILVVMAIVPVSAAFLQLSYLGFSLPTAILLLDVAALAAAGIAMAPVPEESAV